MGRIEKNSTPLRVQLECMRMVDPALESESEPQAKRLEMYARTLQQPRFSRSLLSSLPLPGVRLTGERDFPRCPLRPFRFQR